MSFTQQKWRDTKNGVGLTNIQPGSWNLCPPSSSLYTETSAMMHSAPNNDDDDDVINIQVEAESYIFPTPSCKLLTWDDYKCSEL